MFPNRLLFGVFYLIPSMHLLYYEDNLCLRVAAHTLRTGIKREKENIVQKLKGQLYRKYIGCSAKP